jgi:hypothetical protein
MELQGLDIRKNKFVTLQLGLLVGVSILLRLADLGYSDFQGDEISALCKFADFKTPLQFLAYLLNQRKGPVQYLVTCALSLFDPTFPSEWVVRLPFAIANLIALASFFLLVYRLFTLEIAMYSTFLLATNGIFIAFARIVQYQSFVLLGVLAGLLGLTLSIQSEKWKVAGLYLGFLLAGIGLLAHFDAAFVLPPLGVLIFYWWKSSSTRPDVSRLRRHLLAAAVLFGVLVFSFYIEYALRLSSFQTEYWGERLSGEATDIQRLFQFYNPGPALWIYLGAIVVGLTRIDKSISWQVVLAWLLPPLIFMVLVFKDSRTHAYTYLLPLLIIAGIGIDTLVQRLQRFLPARWIQVPKAVVFVAFVVFSYFAYSIFINHEPEYPWQPKRLLGVEAEGGFLVGTFGFPYSREWREVAAWFDRLPSQSLTVVTNEKLEIASFYLPAKVHYRYGVEEFPGPVRAADGLYFLIIPGPQSWTHELWSWSLDEWQENLDPLHNFLNPEGKIVAAVYFLTQEQIAVQFP